MKKTVSIVVTQVSNYRRSFFNELEKVLAAKNIELKVMHGEIWPQERDRSYESEREWGTRIKNRFFRIGRNNYVCWQSLPKKILDQSDLVILNQENKILSHYPFIIERSKNGKRTAFWGHAQGPRSKSPNSFREKWRRLWINKADWWFGYTQKSVDALNRAGFPPERVTCTNNAIDNSKLLADREKVSEDLLIAIRNRCNITDQSMVGLYCGALYPDKRLDLLFEACDIIYSKNKNFRLMILGSGSEEAYVKEACLSRAWAFKEGHKSGVEKAAYFEMASVILNPVMAGLIILDAFCMGLPVIITGDGAENSLDPAYLRHGPEIVYVKQGVNGLLMKPTAEDYAKGIMELFDNPERYQKMCEEAAASGKLYTQENMVLRFAQGIEECLAQPTKNNREVETFQ